MRLDKLMTAILVEIGPAFIESVLSDNTSAVELDRALYRTIQAAARGYDELRTTVETDGFVRKDYDHCVFNKIAATGNQITIFLHKDDIFCAASADSDMDDLDRML